MSEHSDSTDGDAPSDGGNAWARLALSLAERRDDAPEAPAAPATSPPAPAPAASDAPATRAVAEASPATAWGRIGVALHPTAEPEVEEERPTSAWGLVAGALGAGAKTADADPAPPRPVPAGKTPTRKAPVEAKAKARQERAEAKAKARQARVEARAKALQERAEAKARRRADDDEDLVDDDELLDLDETDDIVADDVVVEDDEDLVDDDERAPGRVLAGVSQFLSTTRRRVAAGLAVVVVIVGLVVLPGGGGLPANTAFRVQGQDTTVAQLDSQVSVLNALYGVSVPAKTAKGYSTFERTEAKALAVSKLIDRLAASRGLTVPAKTASTALDNYINENYGGNQTSFATALGNAGLNRNDLLTELTHQALVQKLFTAVVGKAPTVTAAQVTSYFQAHTTALATQATRAISSIVVATQAEAQTIVNDLKAGQSFATLASKDSLDSSTKANGGVLGTLSQNQLDKAFGTAAFEATLNVPFGPVKDNGHWYVGLVTKITPAAAASDDAKTRAAIKSYLQDQVELSKWDTYLRREIKAADISYAKAYQPADPDQPPQTPLPALTGASIAAESTTSSSASGSAASSSASGAASSTAP